MNIKKILWIVLVLVAIPFSYLLAAGLVPCGTAGTPTCKLCHLVVLAQNLLNLFIKVVIWYIALFYIMYAGFLIITGKKTQGAQIIKRVLIGMAIVLIAWTVINTLIYILAPKATDEMGNPLRKSWFRVNCVTPTISLPDKKPSSGSGEGGGITPGGGDGGGGSSGGYN